MALVGAVRPHLQVEADEARAERHVLKVRRWVGRARGDAVRQVATVEEQAIARLDLDPDRRLLRARLRPLDDARDGRALARQVLKHGRRAQRDGARPAVVARHVGVPREGVVGLVADRQHGAEVEPATLSQPRAVGHQSGAPWQPEQRERARAGAPRRQIKRVAVLLLGA
eukprot:4322275-Prymnesium_polylepis.1